MDESKPAVLVLRGGPDREREVSLRSGSAVAAALRQAGHEVVEADAGPGELGALDAWAQRYRAGHDGWGPGSQSPARRGDSGGGSGGVVFPAMHGPWGEGGPLQKELEVRGLAFVGSGAQASRAAMDKAVTKRVMADLGVRTPGWVEVKRGDDVADALRSAEAGRPGGFVVKAVSEGSSLGMAFCNSQEQVQSACAELLETYERVLVEACIDGAELTVGWLDGAALPAIRIEPADPSDGGYDYAAKYDRNDTRYRFDTGLSGEAVEGMARDAERLCAALGCRHLARVDYLVDADGVAWCLEVNTLPGFTDHSLLPMAARQAGMDMPALCAWLVEMASRDAC
ncbi:MAG: D-alanine--D-alanine ligase [Planctomycetota bacterium]